MKYRIYDITYDEGHDDLPDEIIMDAPQGMVQQSLEDQASDFISATTGFCHLGFNIEPLSSQDQ